MAHRWAKPVELGKDGKNQQAKSCPKHNGNVDQGWVVLGWNMSCAMMQLKWKVFAAGLCCETFGWTEKK